MASSEDVKEKTSFLRQADQFKTPSKRKREPGVDSGPFGNNWVVDGHDRILPEDPHQKLPTGNDSSVDVLMKALMKVETSVIGLSSNLDEVAKATLTRFQADKSDALLMAGAIQSIKTNVGTVPPNMDQPLSLGMS